MEKNVTKVFGLILLLILCGFVFLPQKIFADHIRFWCDGGYSRGSAICNQDAWDQDCGGGPKCPPPHIDFTVHPWQQCTTGYKDLGDGWSAVYITGYCHKDCLDTVQSPKYYDDNPANLDSGNIQAQGENAQNIKLPVVLIWDDVRGFGDDSSWYSASACTSYCHGCSTSLRNGDGYGPISYRIQIQDNSASGIVNLNIPTAKLSQVEDAGNGKRAFYAVLDKNGFNSYDDATPCFFNTTDTYHWRVTACCNADGTGCKDWPQTWWTFTVGTAPEPFDLYDPDWNGPNAIENISFKNINSTTTSGTPLRWCAAKLPKEYRTFPDRAEYAKSYKMVVTSDEPYDFTKDLYQKIVNFWSWVSGSSSPDAQQKTHALSIINGGWVYEIHPNPNIDEVDSYVLPINGAPTHWYPAQGQYRNDLAYFSRDRVYTWKLQTCSDSIAQNCFDDYSQEWKLKTINEPIEPPQPISPKHDPNGIELVGLPLTISWTIPSGANSFEYSIPGVDSGQTTWSTIPNNEFDDSKKKLFGLENPAIKLDQTYTWRVGSCADFDARDCDSWSQFFSFRTTGRPPAKDSMLPNMSSKITFPQNFEWEKVPGAKAYNLELWADGKKITARTIKFGPSDQGKPQTQFDYPDIEAPVATNAKAYTWKVQTCADEGGKFCGKDWQSQNFTTTRPEKPELKSQTDKIGSLNNLDLRWTGQTKTYWVTVNYQPPKPQLQTDCNLQNPVIDLKIDANTCSIATDCIPSNIKTSCVGNYTWKIYPCAKPDCSDKGEDNALLGGFILVSNVNQNKDTFLVCGQKFDNPKTSWDETERCEIKHLFVALKVIIDFFLFRLSVWLLPILVLVTGGLFYMGQNDTNTIPRIKKMWKWIGLGYGLLFIAWFLVSWLMLAAGYKNEWWKII